MCKTPRNEVMIEQRKGGSKDSVSESSKVGSVTGIVIDKKAKEVEKVKLRYVIHIATSKFNLLSITK